MGLFGPGVEFKKSLSSLPAHSTIRVLARVIKVDNWSNEKISLYLDNIEKQ
jgi:hypothetical protein